MGVLALGTWWLVTTTPGPDAPPAAPLSRGQPDYTMDRFDAVTAVELISPFQTIPIHYGTFPAVETDAQAFKQDVQNAGFSEVLVLDPGDTHTLR